MTEIVLHGAHRNGGAQGQVKDVEKRGKRNHLKWRMAGSKVKLGGGGDKHHKTHNNSFSICNGARQWLDKYIPSQRGKYKRK